MYIYIYNEFNKNDIIRMIIIYRKVWSGDIFMQVSDVLRVSIFIK